MSTTNFFYELTPEMVLRAVESTGVRCTGRCLPLNSLENRVYEVEIESDASKLTSRHEGFRVVKFYRPGRWSKQQILEEHEFLKDCASSDVPVVSPLKLPGGETLGEVEGIGIYFAVFPKIGGRINDEFSKQDLERLGRLIARLHLAGAKKPATNRLKLNPETYGSSSIEFLKQQKLVPSNVMTRLEDLVGRICSISTPWFAETKTQRIHGDCHVGNILWSGSECTFVDFDDMVTGPCVQDIWLLVPGRDDESLKLRESLIAGYKQIRSFDDGSVRLIEPLRALRITHFIAWIAKRWEDPAFPRVFVDFGSDRYWNEQITALYEIVEIMCTAGQH